MYLKSIEVQGFKSFANKINFEFHNGITAIVGPNGSGKSNVADAVRWVLGEQKVKQLRGVKMEDVIFSGTETRRALGFAYVAITLDNSDHQLQIDFDEVKVSRRIFRSGESEYMINGAICRLKDIHELFYDTGIGKEGYSIIGQGQIDKILSGKPEDRRELFDEAAGIVKFKRRKSIAIKKLDEEKQNLIRVKDILTELENQKSPLEKQSEIAKKYLKLRDELKIYDINVFLFESSELKNKIDTLKEKNSIATIDLENTKKDLENSKSDYEKTSLFIDELSSKIDENKNTLNEKKLLKEKYEGEINVLNEQINNAKSNDSLIQERTTDINKNIETLKNEIGELENNRYELENQLTNTLLEQNEEEENLKTIIETIEELSAKIDDSKSEIIEQLNEKSNIKSKIQRFELMLEQIEHRKNELSNQLSKFSTDNEKQEQIFNELEEEQQLVINKINQNNTILNELTNKRTIIEADNSNLIKNVEDLQNQFNREETKLESLKNLSERYEGYGNSIRKVMELKDKKQGIIGVVADIIKVDKKYETAIETCLGGNIQNIVTDTEKTAKDIIEYLKTNKLGRATFLPLSSISNKTGFNNERALSEKGVIGLASDLVEINKEYQGIAKYLLGRILVVDHIDNALIIARKYSYSLRIVTLEGDLLNVGGSLTGGAFKNNSNLLGRRREIDDTKNKIELLSDQLKLIKLQISDNQLEISNLKVEIEEIKVNLQEQGLLQNTISINLKQAEIRRQELQDNYSSISKENNEIVGQLNEININNNDLIQILNLNDSKIKNLETLITQLNKDLDKENEKQINQNKINEELRLNYASLLQRQTYIQDTIKRVSNDSKKYEQELSLIIKNQETANRDIEEKHGSIEFTNNLIQKTNHEIESLEDQIEQLFIEKEKQTQEHKDFLDKRDTYSNRINELDKELIRLELQREKLEDSYENLSNYIWNEYELTLNSALTMKNEEYSNIAQVKKLIDSTKLEIKKLGDVNINAIEEYKSVIERYDFLKTQHDDLIKAEETLKKIIDELDQGMRKQFKEKFSIIKKEFDIVFKELFGGGNGTIDLIEDEDILDAGISIIAQPPGKKLQNIMQLSGGEKALTAISLLFAIQNMKPSPFCLLDEIEAALDDSNVIRFSDYLHKLTKFTQFIVITHRKGTMASADRLYGITMQEKGISALVSVNLLESQLTT